MLCLEFFVAAKATVRLVRGLAADAAGVDHHHIGLFGLIGLDIGMLAKKLGHDLGITLIHLAAKGFNVEKLGHA